MPASFDPQPQFQNYAHPERLVSASWLSARLGTPGLRVVESDADPLQYDIGHIPGAVRIDWRRELNDPLSRDLLTAESFAALMSAKGINRDDTVVVYGDKANSWAAFTIWVFELFGHQDVRLLDGGRDAWMAEERDTSFVVPDYPPTQYPVVERDDVTNRAFVADVLAGITKLSKNGAEGQSSDPSDDTIAIVDVRNGKEYMGDIPDNSPDLGVIRHGHIPSAINICWENSVLVNARFRSVSDLKAAFAPALKAEKVFVYCYQGHQAAHAWFVLKYLLGHNNVVNYDGSWAEWGNMIRMPVRKGSDPDNVEMSLSWTGTHML